MKNKAPAPQPARGGHLSRILTLAGATVTQLLRMRILVFLLVVCVLMVAFGFGFPVSSPEQKLKLLKDATFGTLQIFSLVLAVAATALLLPRDVEDRTLYTILSKPVPRVDYLLGKYLGVIFLIGAGLIILDVVLSGLVYFQQQALLQGTEAMLRSEGAPEDEILQQLAQVQRVGLTWSMHAATWAIFLKAAVVTALALLISSFASSTLFTMVSTFLVCVLGQGQELIREYLFHGSFSVTMEKVVALLLAIALPDLRLFDIVDNVIAGQSVTWGAMASITGAALLYVVGYLVVAQVVFSEKEL
ncbi:MAG: ABC transporter permease subunit [Verrucomicrobiales bacterium]|nr:ABC transporter permease subunit [Verrucomicrobiales bacterium]